MSFFDKFKKTEKISPAAHSDALTAQTTATAVPEASAAHELLISELQRQLVAKEQECQLLLKRMSDNDVVHENKIQELEETIQAKCRDLKRVENSAREAQRGRERQIVQQSLEIEKLNNLLIEATEKVEALDNQLERERRHRQSAEILANDDCAERDSMRQTTQLLVDSKAMVITVLQGTIETLRLQLEEVRGQLSLFEKKWVEANERCELKEAELRSLRDALDSEKRMSRLRQSQPCTPTEPPKDDRELMESVRLESLLRQKDRQVATLSNDVIRLRAELQGAQLDAEKRATSIDAMEKELASTKMLVQEARDSLGAALLELDKRSVALTELRRSKLESDQLIEQLQERTAQQQREIVLLSDEVQACRSFRSQHADCQAQIVQKDLKCFELGSTITDLREKCDQLLSEKMELGVKLRQIQMEKQKISLSVPT